MHKTLQSENEGKPVRKVFFGIIPFVWRSANMIFFFCMYSMYVWSESVKLTKSQYFFGLMYVAKGGGGADVCSNEAYGRFWTSAQTWQKKWMTKVVLYVTVCCALSNYNKNRSCFLDKRPFKCQGYCLGEGGGYYLWGK